jgi:signal transduction histidine kinase
LFHTFNLLDIATSQQRYSLLWYIGAFLTVPALTILLFGLLSEYVDLYRRELEKTRALREQEKLREEFISAAAHELKTPVTTIKGYIQMMQKLRPQERKEFDPQAFQVINMQIDRINRRVQEMLEATRFRRAPLGLIRDRFDLRELVSQAAKRAQALSSIHHILLEAEEPAVVVAERERIDEVLMSLVDNAIKFSPKGGDIEVRVWKDDVWAYVAIRDHGIGIARERQPYIFLPFYELVPSGTLGYSGTTALGLYLAKLAVERNGGRIWLESTIGQGTTFYFSLPLAPEDNPAGAA